MQKIQSCKGSRRAHNSTVPTSSSSSILTPLFSLRPTINSGSTISSWTSSRSPSLVCSWTAIDVAHLHHSISSTTSVPTSLTSLIFFLVCLPRHLPQNAILFSSFLLCKKVEIKVQVTKYTDFKFNSNQSRRQPFWLKMSITFTFYRNLWKTEKQKTETNKQPSLLPLFGG